LFSEVVPKIGERPGGYTRVIKLGNRMGDAASMAILELVDYNDVITKKAVEHKEKREAKKEAKQKARMNRKNPKKLWKKKSRNQKRRKRKVKNNFFEPRFFGVFYFIFFIL
jgi:large subunit ribosomal protein L17